MDTATLVAAFRSDRGASRSLLVSALGGKWTPVLSVPLVVEYQAVLTRPEQLGVSGLSADEVTSVADAALGSAHRTKLDFLWRPSLRDADDDMILETVINGGANGIVTLNIRDFEQIAPRFGIDVLTPAAAVGRLEA